MSFTKMKHWQLFIIFAIFAFTPSLISSILGIQAFTYFKELTVLGAIFQFFLYTFLALYLYFIGKQSFSKVKTLELQGKMNSKHLTFGTIFFILYNLISLMTIISFFFSFELLLVLSGFMGIMTLIAFGCLLYNIYFTAKMVTVLEKKKTVKIGDYFGNLLCLLLFPLGVWIIQPSINKIFSAQTEK